VSFILTITCSWVSEDGNIARPVFDGGAGLMFPPEVSAVHALQRARLIHGLLDEATEKGEDLFRAFCQC